ncbi:hypothetical protein EUGRSUZ_D00369 [Eucalyptus grandis]|uniref:Uncharacterized protein n=2 Tax=Eucalyptus grandis TaxID=71139 RepID=A0ACC3L2Q9_EUCGR|nr:hypothetical protein EUGRSUZ_D00369 [Eucalyptus grandis]
MGSLKRRPKMNAEKRSGGLLASAVKRLLGGGCWLRGVTGGGICGVRSSKPQIEKKTEAARPREMNEVADGERDSDG